MTILLRTTWLAPLLVAAGCTSNGNANLARRELPVESQIASVEFDGDTPAVVLTKLGERVPFEQGVAIVEQHMAVAMPERHVEYHRVPSAILEEIRTAKTAYIDAQTGELIFVDGFAGESTRHNETGSQLWTAVTCLHDDCPGNSDASRPNVFALPTTNPSARPPGMQGSDPCPHCGRNDKLESYRTADQIERQAQLAEELSAARAARRAARSGKKTPST